MYYKSGLGEHLIGRHNAIGTTGSEDLTRYNLFPYIELIKQRLLIYAVSLK